MLNDFPSELHVGELLRGRLQLGNALVSCDRLRVDVPVLNQHTAIHAHILLADGIVLGHIHLQHTEILLRAEKFERIRSERRSHDNLQKNRLQHLCGLQVNLPVRSHDAAENTGLVGLIRLLPRLGNRLAGSAAARIHVLHADAERLIKFAGDVQCRIGILYIIVRQLLTIQLFSGCERERLLNGACEELRLLVRVFAVTQLLLQVILQEKFLRKACLCTHICRNRHVIFCCMCICLGRKFQTGLTGSVAASLDFRKNSLIISRIANDRDRLPVLGRAAEH